MPLPLLALWAVGAFVAGGAAKLGGEAYASHAEKKARSLLEEAEKYVAAKQRELARKRRGCIEKIRSQAQMIRAAVSAPVGPLAEAPAELPAELQAAWAAIVANLGAVSPSGYAFASIHEEQEVTRKLFFASRYAQMNNNPQAQVWVAFTAAAYYAYNGVRHAINGQKFYMAAQSAAEAARLDADQRLSAMDSTREAIDMSWDNTISPLIHRAVGPPPDPDYAALLLTMAEELTAQTEKLMLATADERL